MSKTGMVCEVEDAAPTVEQVVAYERFWKMVVEWLVREHKSQKGELEISNKRAA